MTIGLVVYKTGSEVAAASDTEKVATNVWKILWPVYVKHKAKVLRCGRDRVGRSRSLIRLSKANIYRFDQYCMKTCGFL